MIALIATCAIGLVGDPARAGGGPPLTTRAGVVAADDAVAAEIGAATLRRGGSAVDAAVATALALGVVNPTSSGIGGGGFALVYDAARDEVRAYDFREVAPAGIDADDFVVDGALDPQRARRGGLAVAVPGELAGLHAMQRRHGLLSWRRVVTPAARLARDGLVTSVFLNRAATSVLAALPADATFDPLRALIGSGGAARPVGEVIVRERLAAVLLAVAAGGPDAFYRGAVADEIVATVVAAGGVLTVADLAGYAIVERAPLWGQWRGMRVAAMPVPSSGGAVVLEVLGILDALEARGVALATLGRGSPDAYHVVSEALAHGFADRARLFGDTAASRGLIERLLEPASLAAIAARIELAHTGAHDQYGHVELAPGGAGRADGGTSHVCVIDDAGNAVALTSTVNGWFGSKLVTPSGIVLNNEIDDFALRAGVANGFGLVQGAQNLVAAGKRPLSSMSPTLLFEDGRVVGCAGGSGGPYIISSVIQVLLDVFVHGVDVGAAVEAPRIHQQWLPDELVVEDGIDQEVRDELARRGHKVILSDRETAVQAIIVRPDGTREAASDPRKGGAPAVE